jgi:hypothetical protein
MRKRCIRKVWAKVDPIALAISGATMTTDADLDKLRLRELSAIEAFASGTARPSEFRDLCDLLNVTETFAGMGVGPEAKPACTAAEAALLACKDQFEIDGTMELTGAGLRALQDVFEFHDLQRTAVDRSTYERAIAKTRNRIRSAHPSVKVLA